MKLLSLFIFFSYAALVISSLSSRAVEADHYDEKHPIDETKKSEVMKAVPHFKIKDEEEFLNKACSFTHHKDNCKSILAALGADSQKLDSAKLAYDAVRLAQSTCSDIAIQITDLLKAGKQPVPVKKALSYCFENYVDLGNEIGLAIIHVQRKTAGIKKAKSFTATAGAYPLYCESSLVRAGTTGEKLGLYKTHYRELADIAEACHSLIHYLTVVREQEQKGKH